MIYPVHLDRDKDECIGRFSIYIYIIYTPNFGFKIILFDRKREQGRFRGSSEGARGRSEGARGSTRGVPVKY